MKILVTGGAGFIGSALCRYLVQRGYEVFNVDKLTYAGNLNSLNSVSTAPNYHFIQSDIVDQERVCSLLKDESINVIMHLAAESHVDRSIDDPRNFITTNIVGTFHLLEAARLYWQKLPKNKLETFRFHHISTDEVFGDLLLDQNSFNEKTPYKPSSPYSASKAASDHLVRAWHRTYNLPIVLSNCSNNYGPFHFPEKLIPFLILSGLAEKPMPIYGSGENIRDWLYVEDHVRALECVFLYGKNGESYNIGSRNERSNLQVAELICRLLDHIKPRANGQSYYNLIQFVDDRPGHDYRYAVDPSKIERELHWQPQENFTTGLEKTINWYINNQWWWEPLLSRSNFKKK